MADEDSSTVKSDQKQSMHERAPTRVVIMQALDAMDEEDSKHEVLIEDNSKPSNKDDEEIYAPVDVYDAVNESAISRQAAQAELLLKETSEQFNRIGEVPKDEKRSTKAIDLNITKREETEEHSLKLIVARVENGNAILLSYDHNLIEIPLALMPYDISPGNILTMKIQRMLGKEKNRENDIIKIQEQILNDPNLC